MGKITISTLDKMKAAGEKFVCITAYDATFARLVSEAGAETILVGDSLGMVLQGNDSTLTLVLLPRLDKQTKTGAWFGALESYGVTVQVEPVDRRALPQWIAQRLSAQGQRVRPGEEGQRT